MAPQESACEIIHAFHKHLWS